MKILKLVFLVALILVLISNNLIFANFEGANTNLTGLNVVSGEWSLSDKNIKGNNKGAGDCYLMSGVKMNSGVAFSFSADIKMDGNAVGLVFGVADAANPSSSWYCVNIDAGNKDSVLARIFMVEAGALQWDVNTQLPGFSYTDEHNLKVTITEDGSIEFYIDNEYISTKEGSDYEGGYLGIITCLSSANFNNINYTKDKAEATPTVAPAASGTASGTSQSPSKTTTAIASQTSKDQKNSPVPSTKAVNTSDKTANPSTKVNGQSNTIKIVIITLLIIAIAAVLIFILKKKKRI